MSEWKGYGPDNVLTTESAATQTGPQAPANAGTLTYEPYYGLKAKPFSLSTDPRTLYKSPTHTTVLEDLLAGIRRREGLIVLTGDIGTGKTTLCRAALYQLDRKTFTTFVPDPFLSREDLLRMLLVDFGEVSVDDLRRGRLSGASRPDLSYQLYAFLTSLESVDAFAVLVVDQAHHLAQPLLEEIRALSELEAGRRLLQIVLVGQPELQSHLKQPELRQIDQRVTTRCELRPLTKQELAGYVAHRLANAGGSQERIAFASAAIDMIHAASHGLPRVVNVICDRALSHGHLQRTSVIGPPLVGAALEDLQLVAAPAAVVQTPARPSAPEMHAPFSASTPAERPPNPFENAGGLFDKKPPRMSQAPMDADLASLLDLPPMTQRREWEADQEPGSLGASAAPVWKWRVDSEVRRSRFAALKVGGLALLGMGVMLLAGGIAVTAQRAKVPNRVPAAATQPAPVAPAPAAAAAVQSQTSVLVQPPTAVPVAPPNVAPATPQTAGNLEASLATVPPVTTHDNWIVQVAAFSSPENSLSLVQRLTRSGLPAFEVATDMGARGLLFYVRVGPFKTAAEADNARSATLQQVPEVEGAFVRNITASQPQASR